MGDAFTPEQCSEGYLRSETMRLARILSKNTDPIAREVLHRYEAEMQRRGWDIKHNTHGVPSFKAMAARLALT
jgi:hypothetical protein